MVDFDDDGNGWDEWKNHVLIELKRQNESMKDLDSKLSKYQAGTEKDIDKMKSELLNRINELSVEFHSFKSAVNARSSIWGFIGGIIPAIASLLYLILR